MKAIIIEDEILAAERLRILLENYDPGIEIKVVLDSVCESVNWLKANLAPDFILMDIQLSDGSAFEIFNQITVSSPVIFTTAFDQFALDAFKVMSIDYLLKPVTAVALSKAIEKLKNLRGRIDSQPVTYTKLDTLINQGRNYKTRFTGKSGPKLFFINVADIGFFAAENKVVFLFKSDGNKYVIDYTLEHLETVLDPNLFFRTSRNLIVHIAAITHVKRFLNSRLKVHVKNGLQTEEFIVSRDRVNDFMAWAER